MTKPRCLMLAHRLPYPPDKGDKLRAFHLLRGLATSHEVTLATTIDDPADRAHLSALDEWTAARFVADVSGRSRVLAGLQAMVKGWPVTYAAFDHGGLRQWLAAQARFDLVYLHSSGLAPLLACLAHPPGKLIVDFIDVDSAKWAQMGTGRGPMAWIYRREARVLRAEERRLAQRADLVTLVTAEEAALFTRLTGQPAMVSENGVDTDYWAAGKELDSPYGPAGSEVMILTGAMDYPPNIEAALWFANAVLPLIHARRPTARFVIAGARPDARVQALAKHPRIEVTGRVPDMRPWLAHAALSVAPLLLARGVQNKVLEAMASGVAALATPQAAEGIDAIPGTHFAVADGAQGFADACLGLLADPTLRARLGAAGQARMRERYGWDARLAELLTRIGD